MTRQEAVAVARMLVAGTTWCAPSSTRLLGIPEGFVLVTARQEASGTRHLVGRGTDWLSALQSLSSKLQAAR